MNKSKKFLKFISLNQIDYWDVKRYVLADINSNYPLVKLLTLIKERSEKVKIFEEPKKLFNILGVNNKTGLFDAYSKLGKDINQPYKKVYDGDLAYNPYRINVGSIGLKTQNQKNDFISPAYVVFSTNEKLNPDFLYKVFMTGTFNKIINDNTTGSVRQNLKFETLSNIHIPLIPLEKQDELLEKFNRNILLAQEQDEKAMQIEKSIEEYLFEKLGLEQEQEKLKSNTLQFAEFKEIKEWNIDKILKKRALKSNFFQISKFDELCEIITDGTHQTPEYTDANNGRIFLSSKDVTRQEIDWNNTKYIPLALHKSFSKRFKIKINDILLAKNGTTGVAAIVDKEEDFSIYVSLALLRPIKSSINPYFLLYYINSSIAKVQFNDNLVGVGVPNLHLSKIRETLIPLPSLEIQEKMVLEIKEMKDKVKRLREDAELNRQNTIKEFEKEIFIL